MMALKRQEHDTTPGPTLSLVQPPKPNECPHRPKTREALEWALERLGIDYQFNTRRHAVEWRGLSPFFADYPFEWTPLTGRSAAYLRAEIASEFVVRQYNGLQSLVFGRDSFVEALDALTFDREVDPFVEYLDNLAIPQGESILPSLLASTFDVADGYEDLATWVSQTLCLGPVWRAYKPGTSLDEMPVLVGPGGIGKSMLLRLLVPQDIPGLYGSGMDLAADPKAKVESLQGKCLVEVAEMVGANKADIAKMKDFISRTDDGSVRLTWRRDPEPMPRRCVMVGTADRPHFLQADSNNRRFVPVMLNAGDPTALVAFLETNRDRLWGEAIGMFKQGISPRLPDNLRQIAKAKADYASV